MEKNRKQIIICAAIVACVCVISVLITYNILQQKNHLTVELLIFQSIKMLRVPIN